MNEAAPVGGLIVTRFQVLHALCLIDLKATVFLAPAVITPLRYPCIPAGDRRSFACAIDTSIWRSSVTICSALNRFFGMSKLLSKLLSRSAWFKKARSGQRHEGEVEGEFKYN